MNFLIEVLRRVCRFDFPMHWAGGPGNVKIATLERCEEMVMMMMMMMVMMIMMIMMIFGSDPPATNVQ